MGSHHLNLKWRNHHSNLLSIFSQLLTSEAFADVTLACDGASLRAHKIILSACSPFFHNLFAQHPCQHPIVILKDVPYEDLKVLVHFMYHGEVNIAQERLPSFLRTAEALKVKGLSESEAYNRMSPISSYSHQPSGRVATDKRGNSTFTTLPTASAAKKRKKEMVGAGSKAQTHQVKQSSLDLHQKPSDASQDLQTEANNASPTNHSQTLPDNSDLVKRETQGSSEEPTNEETNDETMPSLEAEGTGDNTLDDPDASKAENIFEVESYRQLQRMANLFQPMGGPSFPIPISAILPKDASSIPNSNDEDEDDEEPEAEENPTQGAVQVVPYLGHNSNFPYSFLLPVQFRSTSSGTFSKTSKFPISEDILQRCSRTDPQKFVNDLLVELYSEEYLANHSVTGQKCPHKMEAPIKEGMQPQELAEIINAVQSAFPYKILSDSEVKSCIRVKLGNAAKLYARRKQSLFPTLQN